MSSFINIFVSLWSDEMSINLIINMLLRLSKASRGVGAVGSTTRDGFSKRRRHHSREQGREREACLGRRRWVRKHACDQNPVEVNGWRLGRKSGSMYDLPNQECTRNKPSYHFSCSARLQSRI